MCPLREEAYRSAGKRKALALNRAFLSFEGPKTVPRPLLAN
jgi:hypothetical protein